MYKLEFVSAIVRNFALATVSITATVWLILGIIPTL